MATAGTQIAVIGGGVVGCAVAHALAGRGVECVVLEAEPGLAFGASGTNSGILHTGFDSAPGELETRLILRAAALREKLAESLGFGVWRCGAMMRPRDDAERAAVRRLAANAHVNRVEAHIGEDGCLFVPGEAVTDPVAFVHVLAGAAQAGGATVRLGARVTRLTQAGGEVEVGLQGGERLRARGAVNCAGLRADEVARLAGPDSLAVYPRKGEFLVFSEPPGEPLEQILLPVPSARGKGVLVFPTIERLLVAGPTAREREDKDDWSVEPDAGELIMERATQMLPALARARRVGAYAGLRPAGRDANYVIEPSPALPGLINVAAIRSTGLSASLAIGEHVASMLAAAGVIELGPRRALRAPARLAPARPWWERAARHHAHQRPARATL